MAGLRRPYTCLIVAALWSPGVLWTCVTQRRPSPRSSQQPAPDAHTSAGSDGASRGARHSGLAAATATTDLAEAYFPPEVGERTRAAVLHALNVDYDAACADLQPMLDAVAR